MSINDNVEIGTDVYQAAKRAKGLSGWNSLEEFISQGANVDLLIDIFPADPLYEQEDFLEDKEIGRKFAERLLALGANTEKVFDLMLGWFMAFIHDPIFWEELKSFTDNGLDKEIVEDWLRELIEENEGELLYSIFNDHRFQSHVRDYGIDPLEYRRKYRTEYGYHQDCYEFDEDADDLDDDYEE